jgi:hypothetical protein
MRIVISDKGQSTSITKQDFDTLTKVHGWMELCSQHCVRPIPEYEAAKNALGAVIPLWRTVAHTDAKDTDDAQKPRQ